MNQALAQYSKADSCNFEEVQASIVVVQDHLDLLAGFSTSSTQALLQRLAGEQLAMPESGGGVCPAHR